MSFASMLQGLTTAGVHFSAIGGVAAAAHGSERETNDLDVCYETSEENVSCLAHLLSSWNAYPRGIEGFEVRFYVLDLPGLITAKRAANRDKDVAQLPELEALRTLREQGEW